MFETSKILHYIYITDFQENLAKIYTKMQLNFSKHSLTRKLKSKKNFHNSFLTLSVLKMNQYLEEKTILANH